MTAMKIPFFGLALAVLLTAISSSAHAAEQTITAYNTYLSEPFVIDETKGIAPALVRFLNGHLKGEYQFKLMNMPRQRLVMTQLIKGDAFDGIALLLAPQFVDDADMTRFLWTRPLFEDYNVLAFRGPERPAVKVPADLKGKTFAKVLGNRYGYLDKMGEAGELRIEMNNNELGNLQMVALGRADFTQLNHLSYLYMTERSNLRGLLTAIAQPETPPFFRRILVGKANAKLFNRINDVLKHLPCDNEWLRLTIELGFDGVICTEPPSTKPKR